MSSCSSGYEPASRRALPGTPIAIAGVAMNTSNLTLETDSSQIASLCDELHTRVETARTEEALLDQLVDSTAAPRPFRSRQYGELLEATRRQLRRFQNLIESYCRP
jgi:hypothetical protein